MLDGTTLALHASRIHEVRRSMNPEKAITSPPRWNYPAELPVVEHREEIITAIRTHPVVVVVSDTGSGKTTQLPKMVAEALGETSTGRIGCTQPRRLAAVSVAKRVAEELNVPLGQWVGYQVRFDEKTTRGTRVKFMTDGILLAETQGDPELRQYDALIIDEAHERSLNIDFLLGWLKRLTEKRRDLKIVISSATLDAGAFATFFGSETHPAPVIEAPGRMFPVAEFHQPPPEDEELPQSVARAVEFLTSIEPRGDVLVFLPCSPASASAISSASSTPATTAGSSSPPTSPKPRSPSRASPA